MENLLHVESLNVVHKGKYGQRFLVKDMHFKMKPGEIICITGSSGSGKSISAFSIAGLSEFIGNFELSGKVIFDKKSVSEFNFEQWQQIRGKEIAFIFQNPQSALNPVKTCVAQLEECIKIHHPNWDKNKVKTRTHELLNKTNLFALKNIQTAFPHQLSGGQLQRLVIAMALANSPKLIIADEPTSALDSKSTENIICLLVELCRKENTGLILISHDMQLIASIADSVYLVLEGEIKENVTISQYNAGDINEDMKAYLNSLKSVIKRIPIVKDADKILEIQSVSKSYTIGSDLWLMPKKKSEVLENISFFVRKGEMLGIYGVSGSGKTTLARIITGLIVPDNGKLLLNGNPYDVELLEQDKTLRQNIQMVLQDTASSLQPKMTIREQWMEILGMNSSYKNVEEQILSWLNFTGLPSEILDKYPNQLSGGQQQRVALVRAMLNNPELIIFDESLSALDRFHQNKIATLLIRLQEEKQFAGIIISHDFDLLQRIAHRIIEIDMGKVKSEILL